MNITLCLIIIVFLTLLQSFFTKSLFKFLFLLTKSQILTTRLFAIIMLPGTILHELSHWLVAEILQVPTGKFDYMPKVEGNNIRMGSVQIGRVDPFRRTLVGIAPMISGILVIVILVNLLPFGRWQASPLQNDSIIQHSTNQFPLFNLQLTTYNLQLLSPLSFLYLYLIFIISNTMFSSKKDLEAAIVPVILSLFAFFVWWKMEMPGLIQLTEYLSPLIAKINSVLLLVITLDLGMIILVKILTMVSGKALHRKVVTG